MKKIYFILSLLVGSLAMAQAPNIIFIFCDDLNMAGPGLGRYPEVSTPNIDRLISQGVSFTNAHCNAPICGASRASIFSGMYPHTTGNTGYKMDNNSWSNNPVIQAGDQIFEHFKNNGYSVYGGGKLYHGGTEDPSHFDEYGVPSSSGPWAWDGTVGNNKGLPHPSMPTELQASKYDGIGPLSDIPSVGGYTGWVDDEVAFNYVDENNRDKMNDEKLADYVGDIVSRNHTQPFFMAAGIIRPHTPLYAPQEYFDMYPIENIVIPEWMEGDNDDIANALIANKATLQTGLSNYNQLIDLSVDSTDTEWWLKRWLQGYYACVSFADAQIGKMLDTIESSAYANDTYVVLSSDHGFHMGEKQWIYKYTLWDESTQIPFVVSGPGVPAGETCNKPITLVDVFPTFVDWAGLPNPTQTLDGHSIDPLVTDPTNGTWAGPDVALSLVGSNEVIPSNFVSIASHQHYSVRSETHRYILTASGEEELYDIINDPKQYFNIAGDPAQAAVQNQLLAEITALTGVTRVDTSGRGVLFHGSFEQDLNGWIPKTANGSAATFSTVTNDVQHGNAALFVDVDVLNTSSANSIQLINPCLVMSENTQYVLRFKAKSANPGGQVSTHIGRNGIPDYKFHTNLTHDITDQWAEYEMYFTWPDTTTNFNARTYFRLLVEDDYWLDDVRVIDLSAAGGTGLVCNPGFELGPSEWNLAFADGGAGFGTTVSTNVHAGDKSYEAVVTTNGANPWSNSLLSCDFDLDAGEEYRFSFWARVATGTGDVKALVGKATSPFTNYTNNLVTLDDQWTYYEYTFTATESLVADARIKMQLQNETTYYFDDFEVEKTSVTGTNVNTISKLFLDVYPNPSSGEVLIQADINGQLEIYGADYRLIEEGIDLSEAGQWKANLEPGTYFVRMVSGENSVARKVVVF